MPQLFIVLLLWQLQARSVSPSSDVTAAVKDGVGAVTKIAAIAEKGRLCAVQLTDDDLQLRDISVKETDTKNQLRELQRQLEEISAKLRGAPYGSASWQELSRSQAATQAQAANLNALFQYLVNRAKQVTLNMANHQACVAQAYSALDAAMK